MPPKLLIEKGVITRSSSGEDRRGAGDEPKKVIAIRLPAKVLGWLRKTAEGKACRTIHVGPDEWSFHPHATLNPDYVT